MKYSDIKLTGRFVMSGDKTNWGLYYTQDDADPDDYAPIGADLGGCLLWPWEGGFYMHRNGNNVLFDDNHVELVRKFDPSLMTFNPKLIQDWADVTPN